MQLTSIETTPNPNSMKLNLDESVGKPVTYTPDQCANVPEFVNELLAIDGVKSVFVCHDFITLNKDPRIDWQLILEAATKVLSGNEHAAPANEQRKAAEKLGQVSVFVQTFRGIPIQVKTSDGHEEKRIALSSRFSEAAELVQAKSGADYLKERYWADWGVRYESLGEVTTNVVEEIEGTLDAKAIARLVATALEKATEETTCRSLEQLQADLDSADWHQRLLAVQELSIKQEAVTLLIRALEDPHNQVRRLAAAALGASGSPEAVFPLTQTLLNDTSIGVRRTAGDALSDLGDVAAQPAVCLALSDANKLVRWRAARFLADIGTVDALPFLEKLTNDPEFEVRLEITAAIERIRLGKAGSLPAWKRILDDNKLSTQEQP